MCVRACVTVFTFGAGQARCVANMVESITTALDRAKAPKHVKLRASVLEDVVKNLVSEVCM